MKSSEIFRLTFPLFCQYEITYVCQSNCVFCYNDKRDKNLPNFSKVKKISSKIKSLRIPHVQLTGGEVSLVPFINKIIDYLSEVSAVSVVTNGIRKVDFSKKLMCLYVSFHGSNEKIHETLTRVPNSYKIICKNIEQYVDDGLDVSADVLLTSLNYNDIYKLSKKAKELGMKRVYINRFQLGGIGAFSKNLMPSIYEFKYAINEILKVKEKLEMDIMFGTAIPLCLLIDILPEDRRAILWSLTPFCGAGLWHMTVDPEGNVKLCNQSPYFIGNILKDDFNMVWFENKVARLFRSLDWLPRICRGCPAKFLCRGGCIVDYSCSTVCPAKTDFYIREGYYKPSNRTLRKLKEFLETSEITLKPEWFLMKENRIIEREVNDNREVYLVNPSIGVFRII